MVLDELTRDLFFPKSYFFFEPRTGNRRRRIDMLRVFEHFLRKNDIQYTSVRKEGESRTWFTIWCKKGDLRDIFPSVKYTDDIVCDTILLHFYEMNEKGRMHNRANKCVFWNRDHGLIVMCNFPPLGNYPSMDFFRKLASKKTK